MLLLLQSLSLLVLSLCSCDGSRRNNLCHTFEGYNSIDTSPDCYHDPDVEENDMDVILKNHVDAVEKYNVTTEDGYILTIYRVPKVKAKGVIVLWHPLTGDALVMACLGNNSLVYRLVDAGYDVWLPSFRGTYLSHHHLNMTERDPRYPDFGLHELSYYDTRSSINFVHNMTKREDIAYIGYSMSAVTPIIYSSLFPEESAKRLKVAVSVATPYRFLYATAPALQLISFPWLQRFVEEMGDALNLRAFYTSPMNKIIQSLWTMYPYNKILVLLLNILFGSVGDEIDAARLTSVMPRLPRGFSFKVYHHFWQIVNSHQFREYDYRERNKKVYGQETPPRYQIENTSVPIYLLYSEDDPFTSPKDTELLYGDLPEKAKKYGAHRMKGFNHLSYFVSKHRTDVMMDHIVNFLNGLFK